MDPQPPQPSQRVSAIPCPERYLLPEKPAHQSAQDAHRQTSFVLAPDLKLFEAGMNLQLRIVRASLHSSYRKHPYSGLIGLWSRTYLLLADGALLATRASYGSCAPLVRLACQCIAAQRQLTGAGMMDAYLRWLARGFRPNEAHKAVDFGLGSFDASDALSRDEALGAVYRPASELNRPAFGATLLLAGPESNHQRLALTFADTTFHVGWAEIVLGWLLRLCERQFAVAVDAGAIFAIDDAIRKQYGPFAASVGDALSRNDRCRIEELPGDGPHRFLVHNFRRSPGGAPKKVLL
jgi:hypothetical protein